MRIILSILFSVFSIVAFGQVYQVNNSPFNFVRGIKQDTIAIIPRGCDTVALPGTKFGARTVGALYFDTCANTLYARGSFGWVPITGGIDSVQFEPIIDSTGNASFRVLYAQGNRIVGNENFLFDTANQRLNVPEMFTGTLTATTGVTTDFLSSENGVRIATYQTNSDTAEYKPAVMSSLGVISRFDRWPGGGGSGGSDSSFYTTTQLTDSSFTINRPNATQDTIVVRGVGVASFSTLPLVSKSANYTISVQDYTVVCTAGMTATLPTAVGIKGKVFIIKSTTAALVTIDGNGTETIDGQQSFFLSQYNSITVQSDGANWIIL